MCQRAMSEVHVMWRERERNAELGHLGFYTGTTLLERDSGAPLTTLRAGFYGQFIFYFSLQNTSASAQEKGKQKSDPRCEL